MSSNATLLQVQLCHANAQIPEDGVLVACEDVQLDPGRATVVSLGLRSWFPSNFIALIAAPDNDCGWDVDTMIVQGSFRSEWKVTVRRNLRTPILIRCGTPLAQVTFVPSLTLGVEAVDDLPPPAKRSGPLFNLAIGDQQ